MTDGMPWERAAHGALEQIVETADFDNESGEVILYGPWHPKDNVSRRFSSLEEVTEALVEIGDSELSANAPFEGGQSVFDLDSSDIVEGLLHHHGVIDFFERLTPAAGDPLITLPDLADAGALGIIRVDLESINGELIHHLARHPELIHEVDPRKFEELVATLLRSQGWEIHLTPRTRDGGRDIRAFRKDPVGTILTLVECKRWRPERRVGVEVVRELYGVVSAENATAGMVATTSLFTAPAKDLQRSLRYRMSLRDRDDLVQWLRSFRGKR